MSTTTIQETTTKPSRSNSLPKTMKAAVRNSCFQLMTTRRTTIMHLVNRNVVGALCLLLSPPATLANRERHLIARTPFVPLRSE